MSPFYQFTNHLRKWKTDLLILCCHRCLTSLHGFTIMLKRVYKIYNGQSQPAAQTHPSHVWLSGQRTARKHLSHFKINYLGPGSPFSMQSSFTVQCQRQSETKRKGGRIGEKSAQCWVAVYSHDRHSRVQNFRDRVEMMLGKWAHFHF